MSKANLGKKLDESSSILLCLKRDYLRYNEYEYDHRNLT